MADISTELVTIKDAEYGEQIRTAICSAISKVNEEASQHDSGFVIGSIKPIVNGIRISTIAGEIEEVTV